MNNDDKKLKQSVEERLRLDSRVEESDVKVGVLNGDVTLSGTVPTYYAKNAAASNILKVRGYRLIVNKLKIKPAKKFSDEETKRMIENALFWNLLVNEKAIKVEVKNGVVTFEGMVTFYWQKNSATKSALENNVVRVINKIAVVPTRSIADQEIAQDVVNAIDKDFMVDVNEVDVRVIDRKVTLRGRVPNRSAYLSATDDVVYTWGVIDLINRLKIRTA